jgi:hypothetical protein
MNARKVSLTGRQTQVLDFVGISMHGASASAVLYSHERPCRARAAFTPSVI